jgi:hypothetical protein
VTLHRLDALLEGDMDELLDAIESELEAREDRAQAAAAGDGAARGLPS